jgi:hypothetical protein
MRIVLRSARDRDGRVRSCIHNEVHDGHQPLDRAARGVCRHARYGGAVAGQPLKDNTLIYSTDGSTSQGAGQHFFAGRTGQGSPTDLRRGLLAFDVSAIPSGAKIGSVTLRLYLDRSSDFADRNVALHRVLQDWGEGLSDGGGTETGAGGGRGELATSGDATWKYRFYNTANPTASPAWTTEGGDFVAAPSATSSIGNIQYDAAA